MLIVLSVILGWLRLGGLTSIPFQALAHVYVGGLFGAWLATRQNPNHETKWYKYQAIGLTVLETFCFLASPRGQVILRKLNFLLKFF